MAKQPMPRSLGVAGLSLLITLSGGLVVPDVQLRSLHTGVQQVAAP